jgi:hypothetical protein
MEIQCVFIALGKIVSNIIYIKELLVSVLDYAVRHNPVSYKRFEIKTSKYWQYCQERQIKILNEQTKLLTTNHIKQLASPV